MEQGHYLVSPFHRSASYPQTWMNERFANKQHATTQTNSDINFEKSVISLDEENKQAYESAINFINRFHEVLNETMDMSSASGDFNYKENKFKFPEIPNYASLIFLVDGTMAPSQNYEKQKDEQYTDKPLIETIPESPIDLLNPNYFSEDNVTYNKTKFRKLFQNISAYEFNQNNTDNCSESIKSEEFLEDHKKTDADENLQTQSESDNFFKKDTFLDHNIKVLENPTKRMQLVKSSFNIVNITPTPCNNIENYSQNMDRSKSKEKCQIKNILAPNMTEDIPLVPILNIKSTTTKKVKNMFDKISPKQSFICHQNQNSTYEDSSDADSVILDDEQFERRHQTVKFKKSVERVPEIKQHVEKTLSFQLSSEKKLPYQLSSKEHVEKTLPFQLSSEKTLPYQLSSKEHVEKTLPFQLSSKEHVEKTLPFQLSSKELSQVNKKALSAIGLFTNGGDIKPDIINILESQKTLGNDIRNKRFRSKRQLDFQFHLKPKIDFDDSIHSLSSEIF
ncbi:uncharacterized protein LOC114327261 isoform X1 [Diabrotica virgifera virgifera]|uniref:Uncharacterized protein n=1 Tax=Diabrotica virgifera virgifera TaxID=50390 RepID=A0ABM5IFG7_DIAVI|nr:uncharacterized protein LOC114327261 isoform X1 [Diabrotica virgifera virgifera]